MQIVAAVIEVARSVRGTIRSTSSGLLTIEPLYFLTEVHIQIGRPPEPPLHAVPRCDAYDCATSVAQNPPPPTCLSFCGTEQTFSITLFA